MPAGSMAPLFLILDKYSHSGHRHMVHVWEAHVSRVVEANAPPEISKTIVFQMGLCFLNVLMSKWCVLFWEYSSCDSKQGDFEGLWSFGAPEFCFSKWEVLVGALDVVFVFHGKCRTFLAGAEFFFLNHDTCWLGFCSRPTFYI